MILKILNHLKFALTLMSSLSGLSCTKSMACLFSLWYKHSCEIWRGFSVSARDFSSTLLASCRALISVIMLSVSCWTSVFQNWISPNLSPSLFPTSLCVLFVLSSVSRHRRTVSSLRRSAKLLTLSEAR